MRWPIRLQLMLAMLLVATTATVLASAASVYLAVAAATRAKAEQLSRVEETLTRASYPLTESVLLQMQGLSGAEFVLLDDQRRPIFATMALSEQDLAALRTAPGRRHPGSIAEAPEIRLAGRDYLGHTIPAGRGGPGSTDRLLVVLYGKDSWWTVARQVGSPIVGAGVVAILLAVVLAMLIAGRMVRPIQVLKAQSERIAAGHFGPVALAPRNDELADLAISIHRMTERLQQYETEIRHSEQLRTLDQLGAGLAHALRNSATGARLAIELFQRKNPQTSDCESLGTALDQLELMESFLRRFLRLGRRVPAVAAEVDLGEVAAGALRLVRPAFDHARVRLVASFPSEPAHIQGDPEALQELLLNLVRNALEATGGTERHDPLVRVEVNALAEGAAEIRVSDSGPGPDPETSQRMFEPFVSQKPEGAGLGLYLSRQIAESHGGSIRWQREDGLTQFIVRIPRAVTLQPETPSLGNRP